MAIVRLVLLFVLLFHVALETRIPSYEKKDLLDSLALVALERSVA